MSHKCHITVSYIHPWLLQWTEKRRERVRHEEIWSEIWTFNSNWKHVFQQITFINGSIPGLVEFSQFLSKQEKLIHFHKGANSCTLHPAWHNIFIVEANRKIIIWGHFSYIYKHYGKKTNVCIPPKKTVFNLQGCSLCTAGLIVFFSQLLSESRVWPGINPHSLGMCKVNRGTGDSWVWWREQIVRRPAILTSEIFIEDQPLIRGTFVLVRLST